MANSTVTRLRHFCRNLFRRGRVEQDLDDEIRTTRDLLAAEKIANGLSPAEAFRGSSIELGGVDQLKERVRDARAGALYESVLSDVREAARSLRHHTGFTLVAVLTSAATIGANTGIFSLVSAVLLTPLPYRQPDRIVRLLESHRDGFVAGVRTLNYLDWRRASTVFEALAAEAGSPSPDAILTGGQDPLPLYQARVSPEFFDVFGVTPVLGRRFLAGEDEPGKDAVAIVSHELWVQGFGSDPQVIGRRIELNGAFFTVVGVLPPHVLPAATPWSRSPVQIRRPLTFAPEETTRDFHFQSSVFGRLKPGVTVDAARAEMASIAAQLQREYPETNRDYGGVRLERYGDTTIDPLLRQSLWTLQAAVAFVWFIGCLNLAHLMLARGTAKMRETAIRASLGAARGRLVRQSVTESALLAIAGTVAGFGVALLMVRGFSLLLPALLVAPEAALTIDRRVWLFVAALAAATTIASGLLPALVSTRPDRIGGGRLRSAAEIIRAPWRLRAGMVVGQIALGVVLVSSAGLVVRSVVNMMRVDLGIADPATVLTAQLAVAPNRFADADGAKLTGDLDRLTRAIAALPGVREAAFTSALPMQGCGFSEPYRIPGRATRGGGCFKMIGPSYFEVLGLPLHKGRALNEHDLRGAAPVAVINEATARMYFSGEDPIGRHITLPAIDTGTVRADHDVQWEIVGVVADEFMAPTLRPIALGPSRVPSVYVTYHQNPNRMVQNLVVRTVPGAGPSEAAIRHAVRQVSPDLPLLSVQTMAQMKSASMTSDRLRAWVLGAFAGTALLLAVMGLYGVIAYQAVERTREWGIRIALGATPTHIVGLTMRGAVGMTGAGIALGIGGTRLADWLLGALLFGVSGREWMTPAASAASLAGIALIASWIPAYRAAKVAPSTAIRCD